MKSRNPKSRNHLNIRKSDHVLEVGGGHNPHPRANVVVDKYVESNYHRQSNLKVLKHQQFIEADGENLPFKTKEFDYAISSHVLEHTSNPAAFLNEQMRVADRGYIEVPSLIGEYLFPKKAHRWLILKLDNKLILMDKEKYWFDGGPDLGYLFLTWLPKTSIAYKLLMDTKADFMTVRHEWQDNIEFELNPTDEKYTRYFKGYWNEEMVQHYFPHRSNLHEFTDTLRSLGKIIQRTIFSFAKV